MTQNTQDRVERFFNSLGYTLVEVKDSVFREEKSTLIFQTDHKDHTQDCSTILYKDAVTILKALEEVREEERQAWLDGKRCELCGGAKDVGNGMWSMCEKCTEEQ